MKKQWFKGILAVWATLLAFHGYAQQDASGDDLSAHQVVESVTDNIMGIIKPRLEEGGEIDQGFYDEVDAILSDVVAFSYIARGVMGGYGKKASPDQVKRFGEVFKNDLMTTYAKGMITFGSQEIETVPPAEDVSGMRRVSVTQKIKGDTSGSSVVYTMGKSKKTNRWMLLNVVINGVNLGETFRSQFAQAMKQKGNIDAVIEGWSSASTEGA